MTRSLRTTCSLAVLVLLLWIPSTASAQVLEENMNSYVKRGLFLSFNTGLYVFALQPSSLTSGGDSAPSASAIGLLTGIEFGYDINETVSLSLSIFGAHVQGNSQFGGGNSNYMFVLNGLISFYRSNRLHVYGRVGIGGSVVFPQEVAPFGLVAQVGGGARLYTRLRNFSFAIEALALLSPPVTSSDFGLSIALMPSVMYTF